MSTATLPETPDVARAVEDVAYYDEQIRVLSDAARARFETAVRAAWFAANPAKPKPTEPAPRTLSDLEKNVIAFYPHLREFSTQGERDEEIITRLGFSATRYYQILNGLLDRPEAIKAYPGILAPLHRQREQRRAARRLTPTGSPR